LGTTEGFRGIKSKTVLDFAVDSDFDIFAYCFATDLDPKHGSPDGEDAQATRDD